MTSAQEPSRRCVACGRIIDWNAQICQYCGHDYRQQTHLPQPAKSNTTLWIVIVVIVAVVLVLPFVMYFMVIGFGGSPGGEPPATAVWEKSTIANGFKIAFSTPTMPVAWSDVTFLLEDSYGDGISSSPTTAGLTSSTPPVTQSSPNGAMLMGLLIVWINVTDLNGDGSIETGDYVTLQCIGGTTFAIETTYLLALLYEPVGQMMLSYAFTG